jgi:hypothetical protein
VSLYFNFKFYNVFDALSKSVFPERKNTGFDFSVLVVIGNEIVWFQGTVVLISGKRQQFKFVICMLISDHNFTDPQPIVLRHEV